MRYDYKFSVESSKISGNCDYLFTRILEVEIDKLKRELESLLRSKLKMGDYSHYTINLDLRCLK